MRSWIWRRSLDLNYSACAGCVSKNNVRTIAANERVFLLDFRYVIYVQCFGVFGNPILEPSVVRSLSAGTVFSLGSKGSGSIYALLPKTTIGRRCLLAFEYLLNECINLFSCLFVPDCGCHVRQNTMYLTVFEVSKQPSPPDWFLRGIVTVCSKI